MSSGELHSNIISAIDTCGFNADGRCVIDVVEGGLLASSGIAIAALGAISTRRYLCIMTLDIDIKSIVYVTQILMVLCSDAVFAWLFCQRMSGESNGIVPAYV